MQANVNEIVARFSEFVTTHDYKNRPILTAYVNVDPTDPDNRREQPAWQIELKNETKRIEQELDAERMKRRDAQARRATAEEIVMGYLRERKPTGRSIALFTDLEDTIAIDLPVAMQTRLYYGFPQIKHLLFAMDQYKKYLVLLFSGAEARLVEVFLTRTTDDVVVETEHEKQRRLSRKSMEDGQDRRGPEFERRFINEMATEINRFFLEDPDIERLVLGGNLKLANGVKNSLHPAARDRVVAVEPLDFKLPEKEIATVVKQIADDYEQAHDLAEVEELVRLHNRRGAAVLERQGVETALSRGQVKTLVIPYPMDAAEFDLLIVDAIVNGAGLEFVYGAAAERLREFGGIGAKLYYSPR